MAKVKDNRRWERVWPLPPKGGYWPVYGPVYDEPKWTPDPADEELADWERELIEEAEQRPMPIISPAAAKPPTSYAEQLEEFLAWTSWDYSWHQLEFQGILKVQVTPETEAEARVGLMVAFDRLCKKLKEMNAPLVSHPEFRITGDGIGFLRGEVTIRLYSENGYLTPS